MENNLPSKWKKKGQRKKKRNYKPLTSKLPI